MIREREESSSHQTASSATQSAIFAFSPEISKIRRLLANFLRSQGDCAPPFSPRFSGSLRKYRKYRACWRIVFDLRAPERLRFGPRQRILCLFSPSRIEPVPLRSFHTFSLPQVIKIVEAVLARTFAVFAGHAPAFASSLQTSRPAPTVLCYGGFSPGSCAGSASRCSRPSRTPGRLSRPHRHWREK